MHINACKCLLVLWPFILVVWPSNTLVYSRYYQHPCCIAYSTFHTLHHILHVVHVNTVWQQLKCYTALSVWESTSVNEIAFPSLQPCKWMPVNTAVLGNITFSVCSIFALSSQSAFNRYSCILFLIRNESVEWSVWKKMKMSRILSIQFYWPYTLPMHVLSCLSCLPHSPLVSPHFATVLIVVPIPMTLLL